MDENMLCSCVFSTPAEDAARTAGSFVPTSGERGKGKGRRDRAGEDVPASDSDKWAKRLTDSDKAKREEASH